MLAVSPSSSTAKLEHLDQPSSASFNRLSSSFYSQLAFNSNFNSPSRCNSTFKLSSQSFGKRPFNSMDSMMDSGKQIVGAESAQVSVSPPPSSANYPTTAYQNDNHNSYYNTNYSTSRGPSSSHSSPDPSPAFTGENSLHTDSHAPPLKRLRSTTSFSQIDGRSFEKPSHLVLTSSHHAVPTEDVHHRLVGSGGTGAVDVKALPPIVTREEQRGHCPGHVDPKPLLSRPATTDEEPNDPDTTPGSDETHENSSSSYKPTDTNLNRSAQLDRQFSQSPSVPTNQLSLQPPASSGPSSFAHQHQHQHVPAPPHSANALLSNQHSQSTYSTQSTGYMSALPSPISLSNGHHPHHAHHRASYPNTPRMPMSAPSSATFSTSTSASIPSLPPTITHEPASPAYRQSASAFPHQATTHLVTSSYPNSGTAHGITSSANRPIVPQSSPLPSPSISHNGDGQWARIEGQPPRRRGKLPQAVTALLRTWLMAHTSHPYPTEEEKKNLCEQTGLTMNQVSNWFINARRRILIPPSGCNSMHAVRQPFRRQAQSQLARAASNASVGISIGGVQNCVTPQSTNFPSSTFDFKCHDHFTPSRTPISARPSGSPGHGQYATYPQTYSIGHLSAPPTPHYDPSSYAPYYYHHASNAGHHLNAGSRILSPRSQPSTPSYPPCHVAYPHLSGGHDPLLRPAASQHHHSSHPRPNPAELSGHLKREWNDPDQGQHQGNGSHETEIGN